MKSIKTISIFFLASLLLFSNTLNVQVANAANRTMNLPESTNQTQTHTINLPNLKSINRINPNTGTAFVQSISGDNATIQISGGNPSRSVQTGGSAAGSITKTDAQTNTSNNFASSISYNSGGYSGTLYKSGAVTSYSAETGGYWQDSGYWESSGYWQEEGYSQETGYYKKVYIDYPPVWVCQTNSKGQLTGYCDWEYGGYYDQVWVHTGNEWVSTGRTWVNTGSYWVSTGSYWVATYTTYYTQNYSGTVSKPDTRTYQHYYQYNLTIDYVDNTAPTVSVTNTTQTVSSVNGSNNITLQGAIKDVDNDNVTVSASINGKTKNAIVSNTNTSKNWTLTWNVAMDNIAQGTYSTIVITANDGKGGVTTSTYTGTIIVDRTNPSVLFTPESIEPSFKDLEVQLNITDAGGAGFNQFRYVWSKKEDYPTEGWSEWEATNTPLIKQEKGGKWYLHIEAIDHAGNIRYASSGIYEKIVVSGGPSVNINIFPTPTGAWHNQSIDAYIMESGDAELLAKAKKTYEVTNSPLYPSAFTKTIPSGKKINLNLQGENFIHVQYILDDGTKISTTAGPYLIDTGSVGDFELKLVDASGNTISDWTSQSLKLIMTTPSSSSVSVLRKQYRIEGIHTDWQNYYEGVTVNLEGQHRIFGRIVNETGTTSQQKIVLSKIDQTKPNLSQLMLLKNANGTYNINAKAEDALSGMHSIQLNNSTTLTAKNNTFEAKNVTAKPTHASLRDKAGNVLSNVSFAPEPLITFQSPYTTMLEVYKEDVIASLSGATGYLVGNKGYVCTTDPCQLTLSHNTTLTAVRTEGAKETRMAVKIENIDKSNVQLLLSGKRNTASPLKIEFTWNPTLSSGTLSCMEDGKNVDYTVSGASSTLNGKNYTYHCTLAGVYKGESLVSNAVIIYADGKIPVEGTSSIPMSEVTTNIHLMETNVGKGYIINAKSDNYKFNELPIPVNEITID